jgi:plasmid maintenance system antidote protein VapI
MTLQFLIRERGLKQWWIASQLGISAPQFTRMLQGKIAIPPDKFGAIARILHVRRGDVERIVNNGASR